MGYAPLEGFRRTWPQFINNPDYFTQGQFKRLWEGGERKFDFEDAKTGRKVIIGIGQNWYSKYSKEYFVTNVTFSLR